MRNLFIVLGLFFLLSFEQSVLASASTTTDSVAELTEKAGDVTSSSTSDDKTEVRQLVVETENYYANPGLPMGTNLTRQVSQLKQQHPAMSTKEAVDYIYKNIR